MPRPLCQAYSTTPLRRLQRHPQSALDENPVYRDAVLGLKHEKTTQCHPRGQACSIAPDILPAAVVDENPCPRDTAVVWRVYKGEVRMVVNGGPGRRGSQSNLQPPCGCGQVMPACTTVAAPNNGHKELAFPRCYTQLTSDVSMASGVIWA